MDYHFPVIGAGTAASFAARAASASGRGRPLWVS